MSDSSDNQSTPKKSSLFEVLNRPIHFPSFRRNAPFSEVAPVTVAEEVAAPPASARFAKLREGLRRTREGLASGFSKLFAGRKLDDELLEELESRLLLADVGVEVTQQVMQRLSTLPQQASTDSTALLRVLQDELLNILRPCQQPWQPSDSRPYVILTVGVNGAGKTTTIGKLAQWLRQQGHSVVLAAGDTFRAAAVEQLQVWGERNQIPVMAQGSGADSAAVIYSAVQAARARGVEVVIADTAGRLHTQANLMEELKKIKRVIGKCDASAPHEVLLVLDAGTGQNALHQALQFHQAVGVTGLVLTKLDGTAKGGIVFAIAQRLGLPIRFIGVGEHLDDLRSFDAAEFVAALLDD